MSTSSEELFWKDGKILQNIPN